MWWTLILGLANLGLGALGAWTKVPGLDLTPIGMVMLAQGGESAIAGAFVLTIAYMVPRPSRFGFIWLQVPAAILIGYLAIWTQSPYIPILVFHAISIAAGLVLRLFNGRYLLYTVINLGLNLFIARIYGFF